VRCGEALLAARSRHQAHTVLSILQSAMPNAHQELQVWQLGTSAPGPCAALYGSRVECCEKRSTRVSLQLARGGSPRSCGVVPGGIGRMVRGTRTGCGGKRDGWARPAERVPAQCSLLVRIISCRHRHCPERPCCPGTNDDCQGVWASGDSAGSLELPLAPNGT
jgi:hypothetical protein